MVIQLYPVTEVFFHWGSTVLPVAQYMLCASMRRFSLVWDMKCCQKSVTISVISLLLKVLYVPSPFNVTFVYNVNPYVLSVLCV